MNVTLTSPQLTVSIQEAGAQLCSVQGLDGTQYLWQANPTVWGRHAPVLFPLIGRLRDGQYTYQGITYTIPTHGFARDSRFQLTEHSASSATFLLQDTPGTRQVYPFAFHLSIRYSLEGNRLTKAHRVENHSDTPMWYELGGHDGFQLPLSPGETMADYTLLLPGLSAIQPYGLDAELMVTPKGTCFPLQEGRMPLSPAAFHLDTVILDAPPLGQAALVDRAGHPRVTLDFADFPYLGLWTPVEQCSTGFFCIEPWTSLPDAVFVGRGLSEKAGIRRLEPHTVETLTYTTTFS